MRSAVFKRTFFSPEEEQKINQVDSAAMRFSLFSTVFFIVVPVFMVSASPFETLELRAPCCESLGYEGVSFILL